MVVRREKGGRCASTHTGEKKKRKEEGKGTSSRAEEKRWANASVAP